MSDATRDTVPDTSIRRIPLPLLIVILFSGPLLITGIGAVGPSSQNGVTFDDLLEQLDPEALVRMIIVPQGIVGLLALVLTLAIGWVGVVRLRLPGNRRQWIVGLVPLVAALAAID